MNLFYILRALPICLGLSLGLTYVALAETSNPENQKNEKLTENSKAESALERFDDKIKYASRQILEALGKELKTEGLPFATLAVLPFKALDKGAEEADVDAALAELFSTRLSSQDRVVAVERGRINSVISELNRANTGEISPQGAAQAGKLLGARYVLVGSVTTMGNALQATTRLVASETGEVLAGEVLRAPRSEFVKFQKDVVIPKSKIGAGIRSFLVPGWGQLYNGSKVSGYSTMILGLGAMGTAALFGYLGTVAESEYQENRPETVARRLDANQNYRSARLAVWSYAAIWSYAIFDAYVSGSSDPKIDLKGWADLESAGLVLSGGF